METATNSGAAVVRNPARILLVGDDRASVFALDDSLRGAGWSVVLVHGVEDGLALLSAGVPVDMVVLDLGADGGAELEICRRFRVWNLYPHVGMVALVPPGVAAGGELARWVDAYLVKPYSDQELNGRIRKVLGRYRDREGFMLRRQHSEEVLVQRTRPLDAVRVLMAEIVRELDLTRLVGLIVQGAQELMGAERAVLWVWDGCMGAMRAIEQGGGEGQASVGDVAVRDGANEIGMPGMREALKTIGRGEELVESLTSQGRVLGALALGGMAKPADLLSGEERDGLAMFAGSAAIALANARLHAREVRRSEELEALLSATRSVMLGDGLQDMVDRLVEVTAAISGCPNVCLLLLNEAAGVLRPMARRGIASVELGEAVPVEGTLSGQVLKTGEIVFSADCQRDARNLYREREAARGIVTYLGLPIPGRKGPIGALRLLTDAPRDYRLEEREYLRTLTDHVGLAVEKSRLYDELEHAYQTQRRVQRELVRTEKLRALGELAAGVAHDLNNMLGIVTIQGEALTRRVQDEGGREAARLLLRAAQDSMDLVRRVQAFAKREPVKELARCNLAELVWDALEMTRSRWKEEPEREGRRMAAQVRLGGVPAILGAPGEIREALTNLILNAVGAMSEGGDVDLLRRRDGGWPVAAVGGLAGS